MSIIDKIKSLEEYEGGNGSGQVSREDVLKIIMKTNQPQTTESLIEKAWKLRPGEKYSVEAKAGYMLALRDFDALIRQHTAAPDIDTLAPIILQGRENHESCTITAKKIIRAMGEPPSPYGVDAHGAEGVCVPSPSPASDIAGMTCCENGRFGDGHECMKQNIGGASTRKDEAYDKKSDELSSPANLKIQKILDDQFLDPERKLDSSEISVVDEYEILALFTDKLDRARKDPDYPIRDEARNIFNEILPYLRTTEPVSGKDALKAINDMELPLHTLPDDEFYIEIAKSCAKAWGLPYAD